MIKLGGLVDLKPITEAEVFTATSKETGTTSVFKSKDARDAAIKAGTHEKRKDDKEEILMHRYDTYMKQTKPVLDFYRNHDNFNELDGAMKMGEISNKINEILNV